MVLLLINNSLVIEKFRNFFNYQPSHSLTLIQMILTVIQEFTIFSCNVEAFLFSTFLNCFQYFQMKLTIIYPIHHTLKYNLNVLRVTIFTIKSKNNFKS